MRSCFGLSVARCVKTLRGDLCLNRATYKSSVSPRPAAMMDDSLVTCVDPVTPGLPFYAVCHLPRIVRFVAAVDSIL